MKKLPVLQGIIIVCDLVRNVLKSAMFGLKKDLQVWNSYISGTVMFWTMFIVCGCRATFNLKGTYVVADSISKRYYLWHQELQQITDMLVSDPSHSTLLY
uniref:Uncharacterized protein n=1 Tax=Cacopsylla melanoneura TaxID=428564 RepID=A0A8D9EVG3_9HEMI